MSSDGSKESRESFVRWQGVAIGQLTYAINLVLGLGVAALGFGVSLLASPGFRPWGASRLAFLFSLIALLASVGLGIWCVVNRLLDFRATMRTARLRYEKARDEGGREALGEEVSAQRERTARLGARSWALFWWQIGAFGAGVLLLTASVALRYAAKLF